MRVFRSEIRKNKFKPLVKWMIPKTIKDQELLLKQLQLEPQEEERLLSELNNEISSGAIVNSNDMYRLMPRLCVSLTVQ